MEPSEPYVAFGTKVVQGSKVIAHSMAEPMAERIAAALNLVSCYSTEAIADGTIEAIIKQSNGAQEKP